MDRWVGGWMGGWMDGWMDGWVDEWMDEWMSDKKHNTYGYVGTRTENKRYT